MTPRERAEEIDRWCQRYTAPHLTHPVSLRVNTQAVPDFCSPPVSEWETFDPPREVWVSAYVLQALKDIENEREVAP